MTKYDISGLDCANCAANVEAALRKAEGLGESRLSFATSALYIDEKLEDKARSIIRGLEPGVEISRSGVTISRSGAVAPRDGGEAENKSAPFGKYHPRLNLAYLARILASTLLLGGGILLGDLLKATPFSFAEYAVFIAAYLLVGAPVLAGAARNILKGRVFDELFLMTVSTLGAIAIRQLPEAVGVMLFYSIGEYLQERAVARSRSSITALMKLRPEAARLFRDGARELVAPESVVPGDIVEVLPGERVPLDGTVIEGDSSFDTSSLTGESVPRRAGPGDPALAGYVNDEGRVLVRVEREFAKSAAARVLELVEEAASRKAPTERFITRFAAVYTPVVVGIAALVAVLPPLVLPGARFADWIYRALVILVISCPCALVVSVPLGYFGGLGAAAKRKLLVKGANFLDMLVKVDTVVFDKTGTLTEGVFAVNRVVTRGGYDADGLLAWAAAAESHSSHPVARSIRDAVKPGASGGIPPEAHDIAEVKGQGVIAKVGTRTVLVGNDRLMHREGIVHGDRDAEGTVAYVAIDGEYAGYLSISDRVRAGAAGAVAELKALGVRKTVMLTGDDAAVAAKVAAGCGIDSFFAELLPEGKVEKLESLQAEIRGNRRGETARRGALVFIGDGMNDAPVLMRADVGFAMGGLGSDAAIEAADVVVMDDDLSALPESIRVARFTRKVIIQNILFALGVKAAFIALGALGLAGMWEAVIGDVGVSLLAVLNSLRTRRGRSAN